MDEPFSLMWVVQETGRNQSASGTNLIHAEQDSTILSLQPTHFRMICSCMKQDCIMNRARLDLESKQSYEAASHPSPRV